MVRYRRRYTANPVFLTVVTAGRARWLDQPAALSAYSESFESTLHHYEWKWVAWVLLPNHLHWMIVPSDQSRTNEAYSRIVGAFKAAVTRRLGPREDGAPRWQSHFWEHTIRDDVDQKRHFDYIHFNPVKHRYVRHPGAWPHSSFHHYVEHGWYPREEISAVELNVPGGEMDVD